MIKRGGQPTDYGMARRTRGRDAVGLMIGRRGGVELGLMTTHTRRGLAFEHAIAVTTFATHRAMRTGQREIGEGMIKVCRGPRRFGVT